MAHKLTCPNAQCRANLKLGREPAPGAKITCPRCGKSFAVGTTPASPSLAGEGFALAADTDRSCPECKAILGSDATRCDACGCDLAGATSKRLKKSKPRSRPAPVDGGEEIGTLLNEADDCIEGARDILAEPLPMFVDFDPVVFTMRARSKLLSCAIPNCSQKRLEAGIEDAPGRTTIRITVPGMALTLTEGKDMAMDLCPSCTSQFNSELSERQENLRLLLEPSYQQLHQAQADSADNKEIHKRLRQMEKLAAKAQFTLKSGKRKCFVATACYGNERAPEVVVLRDFRDRILGRSSLGRLAIEGYYVIAPSLARLLERTALGRMLVRGLLLRPLVSCARRWQVSKDRTDSKQRMTAARN